MLNPRYICHLPLIVPGNGALRLGSQKREWRKGELIAFDDTIEHEAWNNSGEDRLVLLFDVWRPELEPIIARADRTSPQPSVRFSTNGLDELRQERELGPK